MKECERDKLVRKFREYLDEQEFPEAFSQRWGSLTFEVKHENGKIKALIKEVNKELV